MYRQLISDSCLITHSCPQTHIVCLCHLAWSSCPQYYFSSHSFAHKNNWTFCIIRGHPCPCWYRFTFMWLVIWAFLARPGLLSPLNGLHCALPLFPELSLCLARHYDYSRACGGLVEFLLRSHWSIGSPHSCPHTHQHTQKADDWRLRRRKKLSETNSSNWAVNHRDYYKSNINSGTFLINFVFNFEICSLFVSLKHMFHSL